MKFLYRIYFLPRVNFVRGETMTRLADRWIHLAYSHSEIRSFKMKVVGGREWIYRFQISLKRSNTRVNSFEFGFFCFQFA